MATVRLEVTGKREVGGVSRGGIVELDDERYNIRALEKAGHVRRAEKTETTKKSGGDAAKSGE